MKNRKMPCDGCDKREKCKEIKGSCNNIHSWIVDGYWEEDMMDKEQFVDKAVATVLFNKKDNDFLERFLNVSSEEIAMASNGFLYEITADVYNQMSEDELRQFENELKLIKVEK
ncbi:MAG: hypothetical protein M0P49_05230 [Bacilli bacterium]|nr:hypothetical protein [Bacilli bacterium]